MGLFLFFYAPVFYLFFMAFENRARKGWYKQYNWKETVLFFGKGALVFTAVFSLHLLFGSFFSPVYRSPVIFYFSFFLNHLINWGAIIGGYYLFDGLKNVRKNKRRLEDFITYVTGFYFINSLAVIVLHKETYPFVDVFFMPLLCWALILYTSTLLERVYMEYGLVRWLFAAGCLLAPLLAASILYLYLTNHYLSACGLALAYFVGSFAFYRFIKYS